MCVAYKNYGIQQVDGWLYIFEGKVVPTSDGPRFLQTPNNPTRGQRAEIAELLHLPSKKDLIADGYSDSVDLDRQFFLLLHKYYLPNVQPTARETNENDKLAYELSSEQTTLFRATVVRFLFEVRNQQQTPTVLLFTDMLSNATETASYHYMASCGLCFACQFEQTITSCSAEGKQIVRYGSLCLTNEQKERCRDINAVWCSGIFIILAIRSAMAASVFGRESILALLTCNQVLNSYHKYGHDSCMYAISSLLHGQVFSNFTEITICLNQYTDAILAKILDLLASFDKIINTFTEDRKKMWRDIVALFVCFERIRTCVLMDWSEIAKVMTLTNFQVLTVLRGSQGMPASLAFSTTTPLLQRMLAQSADPCLSQ